MSGKCVILLCCLAALATAAPLNSTNPFALHPVGVPEFCLLPPMMNTTENCENYSLRYFYDDMTKDCEKIWYPGCGGTQNLFLTEDACEIQCEDFHDRSVESDELFDWDK